MFVSRKLPLLVNRHSLLAQVGTLALFLLAAQHAVADEGKPSNSAQARVLLMKGNVALRRGDSTIAREHYRKSFELEESFDAVCNLGGVEAQSKMYAEAYEHLQLCLQLYPDDPELAETRDKINDSKDAMRLELSAAEAREAEVSVVEYMNLRSAAPRSEADEEQPQQLAAASTEPPPALAPKKTSARVPVSLGLGVVGLAGIGVGVGFQLKASGHSRDAKTLREEVVEDDGSCGGNDPHPSCADLSDELDRSKSAQVVRTVGFAAGGAFLVGSILTYALWPKPSAPTGAWVSPSIVTGPETVSFGVRGAF